MPDTPNTKNMTAPASDEMAEMELTDADILDAMQHIPGYLDISTEDFRTIYHLAHHHAAERLFGKISAGNLMRTGIPPLSPEMRLDEAARALVRSGHKALPVADANGRVMGILTENDFLRRLKADTFLELLPSMLNQSLELKDCCRETHVSEAMSSPAITVTSEAGFGKIMVAFQQHMGRSMPVVDASGRLLGLLWRKDFISAYHMGSLR